MLAASDTRCHVITVHTADSLRLDLHTHTIASNYPGLLKQYHWEYSRNTQLHGHRTGTFLLLFPVTRITVHPLIWYPLLFQQ
jgi:hypothetical protein